MPENIDATDAKTARLVVLISGSGTNLQAFIDAAGTPALKASIAGVISNRPDAKGLDRAEKAGISTQVIDHKSYPSREAFEEQLTEALEQYQPDLIILAGFMRILTPSFVNRYAGKLLNIHPSLLPKYPGLNTHQRAIDAGDTQAGSTVHFVTSELDGGPAIVQAAVTIQVDDSAETLAQRVLIQEHLIYPLAANWVCTQRLQLKGNQMLLDNEKLPAGGYQFNEH